MNLLSNVKNDLFGGLTTSVVAMPLAVAFGVAAFAPLGPEFIPQAALAGLYGSIVAGSLASFFGGTPLYLPDWFYYVLVITFAVSMLVFGVASTINNRLNRYIIEYRKIGVVSQMRCEVCNRTSERVWEKGDFIFTDLRYLCFRYLIPF